MKLRTGDVSFVFVFCTTLYIFIFSIPLSTALADFQSLARCARGSLDSLFYSSTILLTYKS